MAERRERQIANLFTKIDEVEKAHRIGVPPPSYYEEDLWETSHPGHPSNYGDH